MSLLKIIFNPIFWLAAGLHAGLLLIPVAGDSSDAVVPAPNPEGESITVTRIPPQVPQPAKPRVSGAARPATAGVTAVQPRPAPGGKTVTGRQSSTSRPQSGQTSSSSTSTAAARSQSAQTANSSSGNSGNSGNELPELPPIDSSTGSGNSNDSSASNATTTTNGNSTTTQTPPTLIALKEKAESRRQVPQRLQAFLARLQHSVLRTTAPETEAAKQTWLASLNEGSELNVSVIEALETSLDISYPLIAEDGRRFLGCLTPIPKKGLVGIIVDANGAIATEPTLLQSTGYNFLNEIALEQANTYTDAPATNTQQAYTIDINVDYDQDACVELAELQAD